MMVMVISFIFRTNFVTSLKSDLKKPTAVALLHSFMFWDVV